MNPIKTFGRRIGIRLHNSEYARLFSEKNDYTQGRKYLIYNTLLANIANIFITGTFYTIFLTVSGIDIVRVGIINFIPYIAWILSPFSPMILGKLRKRRGVLLFNHIFYYLCVVFATTLMPVFVADPLERTVWFGIFLLLGHSSNALLGSGTMAWHIHFIPEGRDRNLFFSLQTLISSVVGTISALGASAAAEALKGSPAQDTIIIVLRYAAFAIFVISGLMVYLIPKEFPYPKPKQKITIKELLTRPIHSYKFIRMVVIGMLWNFICNMNASTWVYYILNTVGMPYAYTYIVSIICALGNLFLLHWWRGLINRHTWFRMLFVTILCTGLLEFPVSFTTSHTIWVYVIVSMVQGFVAVGTNLVFANMFYINLPREENTDIFITFWNLAMNIGVLLGSMFGTFLLAQMEAFGEVTLFGLPFYGSQFLVWLKCILLVALAFFVLKITPKIRPDNPQDA
ncbi:MAG: hypothetical protein IJK56_06105 [Firmicutes bacterium]|nr:hypothetical protein [Bacillota bacterium]